MYSLSSLGQSLGKQRSDESVLIACWFVVFCIVSNVK